jgi:hypothetical protein
LDRHVKKLDLNEEDVRRELYARKIILEWMVENGIRHQAEVANIIREYYAGPQRVFQKARVGLK